MQNLAFFDTLLNYIQINIKGCSHITHDCNWHETGCKVDYDLWIVLDGTIKLCMQDHEYTAHPNDIIFLYPQTLYQASAGTDTCTFIYTHFDFKLGNNARILNDFSLAGHMPGQKAREEVTSYITSYWHYKKKPLSTLTLKGYFTVLLSKVIEYQYMQNKAFAPQNKNSKRLIRLQPTIQYVINHLDKPLHIGQLARVCGMSEKYFITYFKKTLGITPGSYITQLKMNKALDYLYEHKYSVKEIAYLLGYPDPYAFSKAFKKYYKAAPTKYI
ncbi:MAG: AraC family transcriptional regulator [Firmicutes bacterium]|nr:AraC family transcriptional regulator [Bacillota bacterium]